MIVLGIDPAMNNTGIALLEGADAAWQVLGLELVTTDATEGIRKNVDDFARARIIREKLMPWVARADVVCMELPQVGGSSMSSRSQWTSGITLGALAWIEKPMVLLTPKDLKLVVGNPTASKEDMVVWAMAKNPEAPWPRRKYKGALVPMASNHHIADALCAAYAGIQRGFK